MTQEDLDVLAGFSSVWERVSGERLESASVPSVTREEILNGLYAHWRNCTSLAVCAVGTQRKRLLELAEAAKELYQSLQTEYFLETGDIFATVIGKSFASYTPYNLRNSYKNAVELAELLQRAEDTCSVPVGDAAKTIKFHGSTLKALLQECFH